MASDQRSDVQRAMTFVGTGLFILILVFIVALEDIRLHDAANGETPRVIVDMADPTPDVTVSPPEVVVPVEVVPADPQPVEVLVESPEPQVIQVEPQIIVVEQPVRVEVITLEPPPPPPPPPPEPEPEPEPQPEPEPEPEPELETSPENDCLVVVCLP